jgi:hypothetical protein
MDVAEYKRRFGVLDMMLTGHSVERDRYGRWSTLLTLLVLALSIVTTMTALIATNREIDFGIATMTIQTAVGVLSALIFFLALLELRVDWRQRAWSHERAVAELSELKANFRGAAFAGDGEVQGSGVDLVVAYDQAMEAIVPISEKRFLTVKSRHRRKVAVSRMIGARPGAPVWWLRLCLMLQDSRCGERPRLRSDGPSEPGDVPRPAPTTPAAGEPAQEVAPPGEIESPAGGSD